MGGEEKMKKAFCTMFLVMLLIFTVSIPVSAEATVSISKSSITIQTEDTYQLQVLVNGVSTQATAWGSSDPSVAAVSENGLVTGRAAGSAVITAMVEGRSVECLVSVVRRSTTKTTRYNVLILDTSGSMKGTSLNKEKEAAKRFCQTVLSSDGNNYLAVVTLNSLSTVLCEFTNDLSTLSQQIDCVNSSGGTNMEQALPKAGELLAGVPGGANIMKNVILCSDGLPRTGAKAFVGRYRAKDHTYYSYANAAYNTDVKLKQKKYFIYALGFFHNSTSNDLKFGKRLMKDLASKDKYYVVTNARDIDKVFDDIADKITKTAMSKKEITLYVGESYKLSVQVNGVTKKARWKSARTSIATVNSSGRVTAKKVGKTTITGTVDGKPATCKVTVKKKKAPAARASIRLNKHSASVYVRKTIQLRASVTGKSRSVKWTTSNKSIATVSKNGKVKGVKPGKALITAQANGVKATCLVTVKIKHPDYSQYFMVKAKKSKYGSKLIDEYGVRLMVNKNAVIKKCAVYLEKYGSTYKRTIACKGRNITYAYYVPYLARNGKTQYDGNTHYSIRTFALRPDSHGVWSYNGNYTLITANLEDANGRMLAVQSTGVAGRNTRIFNDKAKMMKWLNK